jgi:anti-sigma factor RsiW
MDHHDFKANQTAAVYVANGLEPDTQRNFELHLFSCPECVEDVEIWRVMKRNLPRARRGSRKSSRTNAREAIP